MPAAGPLSAGHSAGHVGALSVAELKQRLDGGEPLHVIDVRSAAEFAHDGRIAAAHLMPLPVLAERLGELPRDVPIVCVCRSGQRSGLAAELLARHGFTNALNLTGGMQAWARAGLPAQRG
ncbi:MAG: rhodanese-like domain-containing protein [Ardenticatenales bacterium]|nr:rhodanese-like domain-containing protein [Ardenticatenales bacterium]